LIYALQRERRELREGHREERNRKARERERKEEGERIEAEYQVAEIVLAA
jgi:hypothetical protein